MYPVSWKKDNKRNTSIAGRDSILQVVSFVQEGDRFDEFAVVDKSLNQFLYSLKFLYIHNITGAVKIRQVKKSKLVSENDTVHFYKNVCFTFDSSRFGKVARYDKAGKASALVEL